MHCGEELCHHIWRVLPTLEEVKSRLVEVRERYEEVSREIQDEQEEKNKDLPIYERKIETLRSLVASMEERQERDEHADETCREELEKMKTENDQLRQQLDKLRDDYAQLR